MKNPLRRVAVPTNATLGVIARILIAVVAVELALVYVFHFIPTTFGWTL